MALPSLDAGDLEALDRLVEKGEALTTSRYHQIATLIRVGYAYEVGMWGPIADSKEDQIFLVRPTEAGRKIAAFRKSLKHDPK